jgi:DNA-binding transcriptional ArsR family regulator
MTDQKTTNQETPEPSEGSEEKGGSFPAEKENTADAAESRLAILHTLADVEELYQHTQASRRQIADAAVGMRRGVHADIERLEQHGIGTPEDEARYRQLLLDRRHCDVVGTLNQEDERQ